MREFWDKVATDPNLRDRFIVDRSLEDEDFISILRPLLRGRVLEIGCGIGRLSGLYDCGIDISAEMLKHAPKDKEHKVCLDGEIPYPSSSFDSVFCVQVFQHIPNIQKYIDESKRVLKPGGRLIFQFIRGSSINGPMSYEHLPRMNGWREYREFKGIHKDWSWISVIK